jgi:hypothetical protein
MITSSAFGRGDVMTRSVLLLGAAVSAAVLAAAVPAQAAAEPAPAADLTSLQQQLNALRAEYDAKISALETRLKTAEDEAAAARAAVGAGAAPVVTADAAPVTTPEAEPATEVAEAEPPAGSSEVIIADDTPAPVSALASANLSNPGISVVLNGNYVAASRDPDLALIPGYPLGDEALLPRRGFSLGESEVTLAANVDPFLSASLTASFSGDNELSIEEAWIQSSSLPAGFTLKAGRFFSGIGYLNERHAHNWSFIDMPLPYRAFLGTQYGDDGVQMRWLAPTPIFLELGGELFAGDSFPAAGGSANGAGAQTAFVHTGADINDSSSWLAALSYVHTNARDRETGPGADIYTGEDSIGIASLVYKWAPGGNLAERNLTLSGELFLDRSNGMFDGAPYARSESGWYVQGVYQFRKGWSAGLRYAGLSQASAPPGLAGSTLDGLDHSPYALSGLIEYDSSEFGRFRLQYTRDMSDLKPNDLLMLQYTVVYGPHGAHRY